MDDRLAEFKKSETARLRGDKVHPYKSGKFFNGENYLDLAS